MKVTIVFRVHGHIKYLLYKERQADSLQSPSLIPYLVVIILFSNDTFPQVGRREFVPYKIPIQLVVLEKGAKGGEESLLSDTHSGAFPGRST